MVFYMQFFNGFTNLKIEGDFKVIINCYNKKNSPSSLIILFMEIFGDFYKI